MCRACRGGGGGGGDGGGRGRRWRGTSRCHDVALTPYSHPDITPHPNTSIMTLHSPGFPQNLPRKNMIPVFGLNKMFLTPAHFWRGWRGLVQRCSGSCRKTIYPLCHFDVSGDDDRIATLLRQLSLFFRSTSPPSTSHSVNTTPQETYLAHCAINLGSPALGRMFWEVWCPRTRAGSVSSSKTFDMRPEASQAGRSASAACVGL